MIRLLLVIIVSTVLGGCATRGPLKIDCDGFSELVTELPPSPLVRDLQSDASDVPFLAGTPLRAQTASASPLAAAADRAVRQAAAGRAGLSATRRSAAGADVLLLSGGGQWGAFGAGFLNGLHDLKPELLPRPRLITGVSTGGLQAIILALRADDKYAYLLDRYQPNDEAEIVDRGPDLMAVVTGSIAGLRPLKRRIENVLCTDGHPARGCPRIDDLAREDSPDALIGFIEASTGKFLYVDVRKLARLAKGGGVSDRKRAQQCLVGAALASAAMPVFFQQVRVDDKTYYDGGVRQSVFEAEVGRELRAAAVRLTRERLDDLRRKRGPTLTEKEARAVASAMLEEATPAIYVVRNGPTIVKADDKVDHKAAALPNALRAEAIVVNQIEIGSIIELRLAHPKGPIRFITADGFNDAGTCPKPDDIMFSPRFMRCLAAFGSERAGENPPWRKLGEIPDAPGGVKEVVDFARP
jgi:hypothetical protein